MQSSARNFTTIGEVRVHCWIDLMPVCLKDQVVLVVGASSGIGRETAVLFAREGARVVASARRGDRLRRLQEELAKEGHPLDISPADTSSAAEMEQLAQRTVAQFGK